MMNYEKDDPGIIADIDSDIDPEYRISPNRAAQDVIDEHLVTGKPLAVLALKHGFAMQDRQWWADPADLNEDIGDEQINLIRKYENPLIDISRAIASSVQFPLNTAFLHGLGVFSAALIKEFAYMRHGTRKHPGLYVVGAQPPSSGKSPTNDKFCDAISLAIEEQNTKNEPFLMTAKFELEQLEKEFSGKNKAMGERRDIAERIIEAREKIQRYNPYVYAVTDTTPEALEVCAANQHGRFSIISDELEGVSVLFGANYGDKKSPNLGVVLKGFDGGSQNSLRIGRPGYRGRLYGAVAVLAQESTVRAILTAGRNGGGSRGVCERFLMICEPNMLHLRDPRKNTELPFNIKGDYKRLVDNVLAQGETTLAMSRPANELLLDIITGLNKQMVDGSKFSSELMRSVLGKADAQICKLASTLHVGLEWFGNGSRSVEIQRETLEHAASIHMQLIRCFYSAAESEGIDGDLPMLRVAAKRLKSIFNDQKKPRAVIDYKDFSDSLKNTKPFADMKSLRKFIKDKTIPALQECNYIVFDSSNGNIFINPKLRD